MRYKNYIEQKVVTYERKYNYKSTKSQWLQRTTWRVFGRGSTWVTLWLVTLWHWPTIMPQVSFFFLFHNIFLFLCTRVTLWLTNVTNITNHNVIQVLSLWTRLWHMNDMRSYESFISYTTVEFVQVNFLSWTRTTKW